MMDMDSTLQADSEPKTQNHPTSSSPSPSPSLPVSPGRENRHESSPIPAIGGTRTHRGFMGKHRMAAAIAYLDQQIQIIQEELDQLESLGQSSTVCQELITSVESIPDALLPVTRGPLEIDWDRWFQGGHGSRNRRRWI